ncbi:MAG: exo-alpha-sialidase [Ignavibacteriae bacterium]|nr:exo-alpha-sialidase [Ignavibacteriota bacterium]
MKKFLYIIILISFLKLQSLATDFKWSDPVNLTELNSSSNDFAPSWNKFQNILFYNSDISGYSKFYSSKYNDIGNFSEPKLVKGDINQSGNNQSFISFESNDVAYISSFRLTAKRSYMNIYHSKYRKMSWTIPEITDSLQFDSFTSHPTVSPDGSFMIFSSDRNSDHKETDLWMAFKQDNGSWGAIINISELNSPGNEITPFLASKDTLYFSSDGQEGPGGFDMFMSVYENGKWGRPNPLSELNTNNNESDITILPSGEIIFASDRPGGKGKLDLYKSHKEEIKGQIDSLKEKIDIRVASQVLSLQSKKIISSQTFSIPSFILNFVDVPNNSGQFYNHPDSVFNKFIDIIGRRMRENINTEIVLNCSQITKFKAGKIKHYLINNYKIGENRINIDSSLKSNTNNNDEPVFLTSSNTELFEFIETQSEVVSLSPPVLELSIDARPRNIIRKWFYNLQTLNKINKHISEGDSLPAEFTLNLNPYKSDICESDSIIISFDLEDKYSNVHTEKLALNVNHSSIKESNLFIINGKTYQQYIIFAYNKENLNYNNLIVKLGTKLNELTAKKIIVQYFEQDKTTSTTAEAIASNLKIENINVKTEFINNNDQQISNNLKPFLFRILIEQ